MQLAFFEREWCNVFPKSMNPELQDWIAFFRGWPRSVALIALTFVAAPAVRSAPVHLVAESPANLTVVASGVTLVDFGRVAFGNVRLIPTTNAAGAIRVGCGAA